MTKKGFTLIELLVVITIMSILIGVAAVSYRRTIQLGRDGRRKADLELVRQALETYRSQNYLYPVAWQTFPAALIPNYISQAPSDPNSSQYAYATNPGANTYTICASLETLPQTADAACVGLNCGGTCNYHVNQP